MAAQDLQIQPRQSGYIAPPTAVSQPTPLATSDGPTGPSLLISALKHYWWLFILIAGASAFVAKQAAEQLGKDSSLSAAALIHTGLPASPGGGEVFKPMSPSTCAELLKSSRVLNELTKARGMQDKLSPSILQELIETKTTRGSSLLSVEFSWSNAEHGVDMLNQLMEIFIEEIAQQRKQTLSNHIQHVETALLQSQAEVAAARQQIFEVQSEQQKVLEEGGLNSQRYQSILSSISSTQLGVDEKRVEQLGVLQQIEVIQQKRSELQSRVNVALGKYKSQLVAKIATRLKRVREQLTQTSPVYAELTELIDRVAGFDESDQAPQDPQQWQEELYAMVADGPVPLRNDDIEDVTALFDLQLESLTAELKDVDSQRTALSKQEEQLALSVIPIKNQIKMLETRLLDYQRQADDIGEQLTGIGADQYGAYELRLEQAENQQKALSAQLDNMSQLEKCRVREWSISVPASLETTAVSSNRAKLFAFAFGLCGLVLSAPVLASEWYRQQTPPQVAFANSLQLPVLSERILQDFSPRLRGRFAPPRLTEEQLEVVRMLALRIQQSTHSNGSVVLFSSVASQYSPGPLIAAVAECLAQREERVLIVDAVCPATSRLPITNVIPMPEASAAAAGEGTNAEVGGDFAEAPGLSEYLTSGCDSINDMIRHTGCAGVDLISSGHSAFPREALASSSLTELVEQCRENYTMILVNSPAATASTDLQMLTARADGVVLMATKEVRNNPRAYAAVADLIELGAPIIGVVA